jgi:iron complex transport system substrate-binding protein
MRLLGMLLAMVLALPASAETARPRVASINLCADQLLIALGAKDQIVSLGPYARDAKLSYLADAAKALPQNSGAAESALKGDPDLVLTGLYDSGATRRLLARSGKTILTVPPWAGFEAGAADIRLVAKAIKREVEGERLVAAIEAARTRTVGAAGTGTTVLILGRGAYLDLSQSLVHDLARSVGLADIATSGAGTAGAGRFMPLEEVVKLRPDVLILGEASQKGADRRAALFAHPAFIRAFPTREAGGPLRLALPERLTACGGPGLIEALDQLSGALRQAGSLTRSR